MYVRETYVFKMATSACDASRLSRVRARHRPTPRTSAARGRRERAVQRRRTGSPSLAVASRALAMVGERSRRSRAVRGPAAVCHRTSRGLDVSSRAAIANVTGRLCARAVSRRDLLPPQRENYVDSERWVIWRRY